VGQNGPRWPVDVVRPAVAPEEAIVSSSPDPERMRSLVHRYFDLHSRREWKELTEMFAPDVALFHPVYPRSKGRAAVARFFTEYIPSRFLKYYEYAPNVIVENDQAAAEWVFEVTCLDGRPATLTGMTVLEFDGELIKTIKIFTDTKQLEASAPAG
jgi:ketosteroid isomerase-like protein